MDAEGPLVYGVGEAAVAGGLPDHVRHRHGCRRARRASATAIPARTTAGGTAAIWGGRGASPATRWPTRARRSPARGDTRADTTSRTTARRGHNGLAGGRLVA